MKAKRQNRGFTLAELLIVVAIIGVLVVIAIPVFTKHLAKSEIAVTEANIRGAKAAAAADFMMYAKNDATYEVDEEEGLLAWVKSKLSFTIETYAAGFESIYGKEDGDYVYYKYTGGKLYTKDQVNPNEDVSPSTGSRNKYDTIAVRIHRNTGRVETKPYISGTGNNKQVKADVFNVGDSDINGGNPGGGGSGGGSGGSGGFTATGSYDEGNDWWPCSMNFYFNGDYRYIYFDNYSLDLKAVYDRYPTAKGIWTDYENSEDYVRFRIVYQGTEWEEWGEYVLYYKDSGTFEEVSENAYWNY